MSTIHTHTSASGVPFQTNAHIVSCSQCEEDALIDRLAAIVRRYNPYRPGPDPYRIADLLEGKDGPKEYHRAALACNERVWSALDGRLTANVIWGVNWTLGVQVWGDRDDGVLSLDVGPLRLHMYARWGLTEEERQRRWIRQRKRRWISRGRR